MKSEEMRHWAKHPNMQHWPRIWNALAELNDKCAEEAQTLTRMIENVDKLQGDLKRLRGQLEMLGKLTPGLAIFDELKDEVASLRVSIMSTTKPQVGSPIPEPCYHLRLHQDTAGSLCKDCGKRWTP